MKPIAFIILGVSLIIIVGIIIFFILSSRANPENTLAKSRVEIRGHIWDVELAETMLEKARGLSGRQELAKNAGMLFVFSPASRESFWMKGMNFSLDMIWIREGKVIDITKNAQPLKDSLGDSLRPLYFTPKEPADAVLEINAGQADEFGLQIGDQARRSAKN